MVVSIVRTLKLVTAIVAGLAFLSVPSFAQPPGTGTVRLNIVKAGFIVGVGGGNGVLHFHGRNYPLRLGGIGIG